MDSTAIVTALALIEYIVLSIRVGQARGQYGVEAPATTGHPVFERHFRVHQNTLEQLIIFIPALWLFAYYVSNRLGALLGLVFIVGRAIYASSYVADPKQRSTGFGLSMVSSSLLLLGGLLGALVHWFK
jgi:glutathione S-transferase